MKKIVLASFLFIGVIGVFNASAQKNKTKKSDIDPIGIDCDKIYVSASNSGILKFSDPVNLTSVGLVDNATGEVENLWFRDGGSQTTYKTVYLRGLEVEYSLLVDFKIIDKSGAIIVFGVTEPCSRQIVIGQK